MLHDIARAALGGMIFTCGLVIARNVANLVYGLQYNIYTEQPFKSGVYICFALIGLILALKGQRYVR